MKKWTLWMAIGAIFALLLTACASSSQGNAPTVQPTVSMLLHTPIATAPPTTAPTAPPVSQSTAATGLPNTGAGAFGKVNTPPPTIQSSVLAARIVPPEKRPQLTYLSNWMNMRVADSSGQVVGTVNDYILNLCESHVIYILMNTGPALGFPQGSQMLIPFEIPTTTYGTLDANQHVIILSQTASEVAKAPLVQGNVNLSNPTWEPSVQQYWGNFTRFSLSVQCGTEAPYGQGNPIAQPKIGFASNVLKATLQDEKGQTLGHVVDVVVEPESGFIHYLAVQRTSSMGGGVALLPTGALSIPQANASKNGSLLTLIVDPSILKAAPTAPSLPDPSNTQLQSQSFSYWSQYVKMTK